jgi:hypothetical protein
VGPAAQGPSETPAAPPASLPNTGGHDGSGGHFYLMVAGALLAAGLAGVSSAAIRRRRAP